MINAISWNKMGVAVLSNPLTEAGGNECPQ